MSYSNYIIDYVLNPDNNPEAVSLSEAKAYCRVTTDTENTLFELLIKQAREAIEVATGLSLMSKSVTVWFSNFDGKFQLPFGPVNSITSITTEAGTALTEAEYNLVGLQFPTLTRPIYGNMMAIYTTGYSTQTLPADLKVAILDQVSYDYENRGLDSDTGICQKSWKACQRWTRISPIL